MIIHRRQLLLRLAGLGFTVPAWPLAGLTQVPAKVPRVAYLSPVEIPQRYDAFREGMAEAGFIEGVNLTVSRYTAAAQSELPSLAAAAVASRPDTIFTQTTAAAQAAKGATSTIAIVFTNVADPIGSGLVTNLARPGGNITGNTILSPDLIGKQIAILREIVPGLRRLGVVNGPGTTNSTLYAEPVLRASTSLGIEVTFIDFAQDDRDVEGLIRRFTAASSQAVFCPPYALLTDARRDLLFDMLVRYKLPAIAGGVMDGAVTPIVGVISYSPNILDVVRRASAYVASIMRGARPGDLPVEQPTAFDFSINLDVARKIGLAIPPSILAQATIVVDEDWRAPKGAAR